MMNFQDEKVSDVQSFYINNKLIGTLKIYQVVSCIELDAELKS